METSNEKILNYSDNFFTETEQEHIAQYCINAKYSFGEQDNENTPVTGMTHNIPESELIYKLIAKTLYDRVEFIRDLKLYRMYVNCFAPSEEPYFHTDGEGFTFLYYPIQRMHNLDDGGETFFLVDDDLMGIMPISNRMVIFDAGILHKATSYRNDYRFTIAIKYH